MAAGQTPSPAYKQGDMPYGAATDISELEQAYPFAELQGAPDEEYIPANTAEKFLFGPTDRPNEPITTGAPFGAGPPGAAAAYESSDQLLQRVALQIGETPGAAPELRAFAARVAKGE